MRSSERGATAVSNVFISYAKEDKSIATKLAKALEKYDCTVWWDRDIPPGRPFEEVIREHLDDAKCVVVLWSKHSATSHWVKDEASTGLDRGILVPALIENVAIPLGFGQTHAANLIGWNGAHDDDGFQAFLNSVRSLTGNGDTSREPIKSPRRISLWRHAVNVITVAVLALFSLAIVSMTCANPDNVMISIIAGLPVAAFLLLRVRSSPRFLWLLAPAITWFIASPIGNGYGQMAESPLFGIRTGSFCQQSTDALYVLGGLLLVAVVADLFSFFWDRRYRRWAPLTAMAILLSAGAWLAANSIFRHSDQYELASELARKYGYFSNGDDLWSRPAASGFPNDFQATDTVVRDDATGLTWHRAGSPDSIPFSELQGYIRSLNTSRVGGFDDWRIPNLAEAWTLLERRQQNGVHVDPLFDSQAEWIWTSTIAEDGYGWFMMFDWGRPLFQNAWESHAYVRAVRGDAWE